MVQIEMNKSVKTKQEITTLFFMNQGNSEAECVFEKDGFQPTEEIKIFCTLDNSKCGKDVSKIKVALKRHISAQDSNGNQFTDTVKVLKGEFHGVHAGHREERVLTLDLKKYHNKEKEYLDEYISKPKKRHPLTLEDIKLAGELLPTTRCQLIQCNYFVQVKFSHKGFTLGSKIPPAVMNVNIFVSNLA